MDDILEHIETNETIDRCSKFFSRNRYLAYSDALKNSFFPRTIPISPSSVVSSKTTEEFMALIVPRLFKEKRRDIIFGFLSFCPSIHPSFRLSARPSVPPKVLCTLGGTSSYSFMPILLKLYRSFSHGLKTCMWFGYYPEIIFVTFSAI